MSDFPEFEAFVRKHQDLVFSTAMRLLARRDEAQDIAQEVFLKAYRRFDELRHSPTAAGWLRTVARNLSLKHLERYRWRWTFFSELLGARWAGDRPEIEPAASDSVAAAVAAGDRAEVVEKALRQLPTPQRVALVLYHMEGMQYDQIAAQLGVSLGKVKTDIFRGRAALRKILGPQMPLERAAYEPGR